MKLDDNIAIKQSEALVNKAGNWLSYINKLSVELKPQSPHYLLEVASLWATTYSYIEWLLLFSLYGSGNDQISQNVVADRLTVYWGWSKELGKLFWKSGRNPIAHVGYANSFHSYENFNGLPTNVSLNSANNWTEAVMGEWHRYYDYRAVAILPHLDKPDGTVQIVTFFHQMLKDELLPELAEKVAWKILEEKDWQKLEKLYKLNLQIPY